MKSKKGWEREKEAKKKEEEHTEEKENEVESMPTQQCSPHLQPDDPQNHRDGKQHSGLPGAGERGQWELFFNEYKVTVLPEEKNDGDELW